MKDNKSALELLIYPVALSFGFCAVFFMTRETNHFITIGKVSLILLGISWFIWLVVAVMEIRERCTKR